MKQPAPFQPLSLDEQVDTVIRTMEDYDRRLRRARSPKVRAELKLRFLQAEREFKKLTDQI